jgi:hypothetical protein
LEDTTYAKPPATGIWLGREREKAARCNCLAVNCWETL